MWGSSPTFFSFSADVCRRAAGSHTRSRCRARVRLVDLRRTGTLQRPILQVRVDRPDSRPGQGITADDCAGISRSLERFLESRAMVGPRYVLEVSSPGLDRPLRWPEHWRRFIGRQARVRAEGLTGRQRVEILAVPDDERVIVRGEDGSEMHAPAGGDSGGHLDT